MKTLKKILLSGVAALGIIGSVDVANAADDRAIVIDWPTTKIEMTQSQLDSLGTFSSQFDSSSNDYNLEMMNSQKRELVVGKAWSKMVKDNVPGFIAKNNILAEDDAKIILDAKNQSKAQIGPLVPFLGGDLQAVANAIANQTVKNLDSSIAVQYVLDPATNSPTILVGGKTLTVNSTGDQYKRINKGVILLSDPKLRAAMDQELGKNYVNRFDAFSVRMKIRIFL